MSRRVYLLKKHSRLTLGDRAEKTQNSHLPDSLRESEDGDILWVNNPNAFRELNWGTPPQDQIKQERDAMFYESQILSVVPTKSKTATGAAIAASESQLNREGMQTSIVDCYKWIVNNCLSIMSDQRYTPNEYVLNIAPEGAEVQIEALKGYWLLGRRRIDIEAGSMLPLVEQLERQDTLGLVDRLLQMPEADRPEVIKMMIKAFRKIDPERLIKSGGNADSVKAAQLELNGWLLRGVDPGVQTGEDHNVHIQIQSPEALSRNQTFTSIPVEQQKNIQGVVTAHVQQHLQYLQQEGGRLGGVSQEGEADLISQVQSNAQNISEAITAGEAASQPRR